MVSHTVEQSEAMGSEIVNRVVAPEYVDFSVIRVLELIILLCFFLLKLPRDVDV